MKKYPGINGLRAVSILLVIMHHLEFQNHIFANLKLTALKPFISFVTDGHLGVNIFFIISGFLISSLMLEEERRTNTVSLKNFYVRRTLRIFPAYYFLLFIYFILQLIGVIHLSASSWVTSVSYTKYLNWGADWFTAHAWSLSIEEQFYLFWPIIFVLGDRVRRKSALFLTLIVPFTQLYVHYRPVSWINDLTIFTRIDSIAIGCLIAFYKDKILKLLNPHFRRAFLFSLIALFFLRYLPLANTKFNLHLNILIVSVGSTYGTIANILIGIILLYSVFESNGIWHRILNSKILNFIGLLSYSIYLWQQIFLSGLKYWPMMFPQNLIFVFITAMFSYYYIEKPILKLRDKLKIAGTPSTNRKPLPSRRDPKTLADAI